MLYLLLVKLRKYEIIIDDKGKRARKILIHIKGDRKGERE